MSVWLGVAIVAASAGATGFHSGDCSGRAAGGGPVAELIGTVGEALDADAARLAARTRRFVEDPTLAPCVGTDHSHRSFAEDRELAKIEEEVKKKVEEVCAENVCASNLGYGLLAWNPWVPVFGGCSNWALAASDAVGQPSYFDKHREQRCTVAPHCHYVVVLTNPRTGEEHVVDAWSYAGGWSGKGARKGSPITTRSRFNGAFPNEWFRDGNARGRCTRAERSPR